MAYRNTLQADALKLVAQKLQSSLAVEGELPEDGLAAYDDDSDDLMLALARKLVSGEADAESVESVFAQAQRVAADAESVESVFEQAMRVAAEAEALLVDDDWRPAEAEPQPLTVALYSNGHMPSVELLPCEHHVPASPGQQSLFSWAEFMTGDPQPSKRRGLKVPPASRSLFEWALKQEQTAGPAAAAG